MHRETKTLFGLVGLLALLALGFWGAAYGWKTPGEDASAELVSHYRHHSGIWRAVVMFLAIACTLSTVLGAWIAALTAARLDAERGKSAAAHH